MKISVIKLIIFSVLISFMACKDDDDCSCNDGNIEGKWEVIQFISVESRSYPKDDDYNPTIEFKNDGSTVVNLDANACNGDYEIVGVDTISISGVGCTKMCCDSDFSIKFVEMLPQVGSYEIEDDGLKLHIPAWGWIKLEFISD